MRKLESNSAERSRSYLVYYVDEGLSIVSTKADNSFDLLTVREYSCDQRGTLGWCERTGDQTVPCRANAAAGTSQLNSGGLERKLTAGAAPAISATPAVVDQLRNPNSVGLTSTTNP